ncbi:MAG: alanine--tRNA ligase [Planctomycetes bacterium]|nr:alanine--tRNA ligase [Planctomycetota bacterium]
MKCDELREKYLSFFQSQGHSRQPSDVLVPTWDPSVLFTPAGMNPFKDHFLGKVKLEFTRATTCQKCLRTGDIDNVGRTAYHHTFFEMLGNFSFGDYFKKEAIHWAWQFLTDPKWLGIPSERLSVTVYKDDDEAANIWNSEIGLPSQRISRMDEDENFWPASAPSQGPDGVCGPCSEIYYQLDNGKSVEIWNLVFTQFNRVGNPPNNLQPLPSKNIDTGMGLERTASVLQNVPTNFHIDSLYPIVLAAAEVCGTKYEYTSDNGRRLRRITDHIRACTFAVHENVYPGPKKARYVIKRLIRRAVLDGHQMGMHEPFLYNLVPMVAQCMKSIYPELSETTTRVAEVIRREENEFFQTIDAGLNRIQQVFTSMDKDGKVMVDGNEAASLYQTHGVPPELFQTLAAEKNFTFDWDGYRAAMGQHGLDSGGEQKKLFQTGPIETLKEALLRTDFMGYETTECSAQVRGIIVGPEDDDRLIGRLSAGGDQTQLSRVVLDRTPFYGESGGQVGDSGVLQNSECLFRVTDTQKAGELFIHYGHVERGELKEGMTIQAVVDTERRQAIRRAHSATHLLHYALQQTLGGHAQQQGSKVDADWLRFDFSNQSGIDDDTLRKIEQIVNEKVNQAAPVVWNTVPLADARKAGAMMLFGEKYPDPVRMVSMGEFSKELCGGTHLHNTSEVKQFEIISEEGVSSGVRRIIALTGDRAHSHREWIQETLVKLGDTLKCAPQQVADYTGQLMNRVRQLKKAVSSGQVKELPAAVASNVSQAVTSTYNEMRSCIKETARAVNVAFPELVNRVESLLQDEIKLLEQLKKLASGGEVTADQLLENATEAAGGLVITAEIPGANPNLMRQLIDAVRKKSSKPTAVLLTGVAGPDKVIVIAGLSNELVAKGLSAGTWASQTAQILGGSGGGRPDLAQAGGKNPEKITEALEAGKKWMLSQL